MRLKNKSDLYIITENMGLNKDTADQFISLQLSMGMIEPLCDGWYIHHE